MSKLSTSMKVSFSIGQKFNYGNVNFVVDPPPFWKKLRFWYFFLKASLSGSAVTVGVSDTSFDTWHMTHYTCLYCLMFWPRESVSPICRIFTESVHWAYSVVESQCPDVCLYVCVWCRKTPFSKSYGYFWSKGILLILGCDDTFFFLVWWSLKKVSTPLKEKECTFIFCLV